MPDSAPSRPTPPLPTTARLSLGDPTPSLSTPNHLRFQLDHALARDAVHTPLDTDLLLRGLRERGLSPLVLNSNASAAATGPEARATYLRRPDLGRTLHPDSIAAIEQLANPDAVILTEAQRSGETPVFRNTTEPQSQPRILFLLADGLSAFALEHHSLPLLDATLPLIPNPCSLIPLVQNARVAIADPIGQLLHATIAVLLIGERPGLSSPDSLGCYITWKPRPGLTDADRNCISNIRGPKGLSYAEAAHRIAHYLREAQRLQTTGTTLKDPTGLPIPRL